MHLSDEIAEIEKQTVHARERELINGAVNVNIGVEDMVVIVIEIPIPYHRWPIWRGASPLSSTKFLPRTQENRRDRHAGIRTDHRLNKDN